MKKLGLVLAVVFACTISSTTDAQLALRAGGARIFDGSQPGGHVSLILPFSSKPAGVMIAADYYKKDGLTTAPISARGLYNLPVGEAADIYLGIGSGFIYTKNDAGTVSLSSTEILFSAVGGLRLNLNSKFGVFGEMSMERALISNAENNLAGKVGISITLSE
jgi:hypothetical protein